MRSERDFRLQIFNGSAQPLDIFWLRSRSERVPRGSVGPGENTLVDTFRGHRFALVGRESGAQETVTAALRVQAFVFQPQAPPARRIPEGRVIPPPPSQKIPPFYAKFLSARGFPIVGSATVSDYALKEAGYLVNQMLARRPDVRRALIDSGARLCLLAWNEFTTDLPEFVFLGKGTMDGYPGIAARDFWDARARGTGGSETDPYCSSAEENLLGYPGDPYAAECILIHEFAHCIHLRGMTNVDPTFDSRLKKTYDTAMRSGLWKGKYASVNHHEYFAEGVQSWFDNNRVNDHDHNHVHTRTQLREYDPGLAALCREVFGDTELRYTRPETRLTGHLDGYDPAAAPTFVWPERLKRAQAEIRARAQARGK